MDKLLNSRMAGDGALGGVAATAPLWLQDLQTGVTLIAAVGGVVLIGFRIAIAYLEWRNLRRSRK